jgi:hypothetical protein
MRLSQLGRLYPLTEKPSPISMYLNSVRYIAGGKIVEKVEESLFNT